MNKKTYSQPQSAVTRVELESPICSGSATIVNPKEDNYKIEAQKVNTDFDSTLGGGGWEDITTINS